MTPESERRNSAAMYNPMLISDLKENYPRFDWGAYFTGLFDDTNVTVGDDERIIVVQPDYFESTNTAEATAETVGTKHTST